MAEALYDYLSNFNQQKVSSDDDKLLIASLEEVRQKLYLKLGKFQSDYTMTLTPTQAFAIRILFHTQFIHTTGYLANKLHLLSCDIDKMYN